MRDKLIMHAEAMRGKTIEYASLGGGALSLRFTDGTFCILKGYSGRERGDEIYIDFEMYPTRSDISELGAEKNKRSKGKKKARVDAELTKISIRYQTPIGL